MPAMPYKILFLDTETTGVEAEDRLCQIAYKTTDVTVCEMYCPPLPIKIAAMATHHITNEMVANRPRFRGSAQCANLQAILAQDGCVLVAHNAKFDVAMLEKEGVSANMAICTLRVARELDKNGVIESYSLQHLRYLLGIYREVAAVAHDAAGDIAVLEKLFDRLLAKVAGAENVPAGAENVTKNVTAEDFGRAVERMIEISKRPSLIRKFKFGKHAGKPLADVAAIDPGYLDWLYRQKRSEETQDEDWIYTLEYYLNRLHVEIA
jgi:exodeoxyribonuclease X